MLGEPLEETRPHMTKNTKLLNWVNEVTALCQPDKIHWCDGSQKESDELCALM